MDNIDDLLQKRRELLEEIDKKIKAAYTKAVALLFTDIVGSTEFFEQMGDIAGRAMIKTHNDLLFPIIESYKGTIIKTIGDSIMASFTEPCAAVNCAVEMQKKLAEYNSNRIEKERIIVRMGLHWGEAVADGKDLFGDMVNTSARVESKAKGGEILISGQLKSQLAESKLPLIFLGSEQVKGKKNPLDFYLINWNKREEAEILKSWGDRIDKNKTALIEEETEKKSFIVIHGNIDIKKFTSENKDLKLKGNPYLNRVMLPPTSFYGRTLLLRKVFSRIAASHPQSVSLVGERRIGKSSLLNFIFYPPSRYEHLGPEAEKYIFLLLDFQQMQGVEAEEIIKAIYKALKKDLEQKVEIKLETDYNGLKSLAEEVSKKNFRLVILCDEFEAVTKNEKLKPDFYAFLRSLANNYPIAFITASARNLKDMCVNHKISDSPFFNIFASQAVGLFSEEEAKELISIPSAKADLSLAPLAEQIIVEAGTYPFFLQIMCSAWFDYLNENQKKAVEFRNSAIPRQVLDTFLEEATPHFEYIWETLSQGEKNIFCQILAEKPISSQDKDCVILLKKGYVLENKDGQLKPFSRQFDLFLKKYL